MNILQTTTWNTIIFGLLSAFSLFTAISGESNVNNLGSRNSSLGGLMDLHRSKRATDSKALGECATETFVYCPYKFDFQMSPTVKSTKAELALCNTECPGTKDLDTTVPYEGCEHEYSCLKKPDMCKALGASCFRKNMGETTLVYDCCNGRIVTPDGVKIPVAGDCNLKTLKCEPTFPLNTVCGNGMKEYLRCYVDPEDIIGETARCAYPTEPIKEPSDDKPRVVRAIKQTTTNGVKVEEPGRCRRKINTCNTQPPLKIFCGPKLPKEYDNFPFCACPSPDGETGYHCNIVKKCVPCKLAGVSCGTTADCCTKHICSQGKCVRS